MGRAAHDIMLETPYRKTKFGGGLFDFNGSRLCILLPKYLRAEKNIDKFKKCLKTLLFNYCDQMKDKANRFIDMRDISRDIIASTLEYFVFMMMRSINTCIVLSYWTPGLPDWVHSNRPR